MLLPPTYRLHWSSLILPVLILILGISAYSYRWYTPTLPFVSGKDLYHVGRLIDPQVPLQTGDRVVQLNGRTPEAWARAGPVALPYFSVVSRYTITIERRGAILPDITVPAVRVPLHLALLWWSSALLLGMALLLIAAVPDLLGKSGPAEQGVRLAFLGLAAYQLCVIPLLGAPPISWVLEPLLIPVQIMCIGFTSGVFVFFLGYPRHVPIWHPRLLPPLIYVGSMSIAGTIVLLSPGGWLDHATLVTRQVVNGMAASHAALALVFGVRAYRQTRDPLVRAQFRWLVWGGVVGVLPWLVLWAIPNALLNEPLVPFLTLVYLPMLAVPFSFALAILRYRLLDIDALLNRTLVYLFLTLGLGLVYVVLTAGIGRIIPAFLGIGDDLVIFLTVLALAALFNPALLLARDVVEHLFYGARYQVLQQIEQLRHELRYVGGWETLLPMLNQEIPQRLGLSHAQYLSWVDGHFVSVPLQHGGENSRTAPDEVQLALPPDWPLDQPLLLQNWEYVYIERLRRRKRLPGVADLEWARPLLDAGFHLAFILVAGGQPVGVYALGRQCSGDWYERSTITALHALTDRIAIAVANAHLLEQTVHQARLRHELAIARRIQQSLLPANHVPFRDLEVCAVTLSASDVGGDFYTVQPLADDRLSIAVGDVSGKGIGAALLMAVTSTILTTIAGEGDTPPLLLTRVNQLLRSHTAQHNQNVALCALQLYAGDSGEYRMLAASGGAIPVLVRRNDGRLEWLTTAGLPLGTAIEESLYRTVESTLYQGDLIIICTDGLFEVHDVDGRMLSFEGIERTVAATPLQQTPRTILQRLLDALYAHTGGADPQDDVTILVVGFHNSPPT